MARSNLTQRLLSALVAIPTMLALIFVAPPEAWLAFVALATVVGGLELFGMVHPDDKPSRVVCTIATVGVLGVLWQFGKDPRALLAVVFLTPLFGLLLVLARLGDVKTAALRVTGSAFGPIYLGGGMASLVLLRRDLGADGSGYVLLSLMLSWMSDTGAYFAGRFLGKHKLYEAVSPKKTIEGALGGLAGAVVGVLLAHFVYLRSLPLLPGLGLAIVAGALGQAGDLGESLLKRSFGVKDSGGIVPGHGGILDRVDALLVTGSLSYLYAVYLR